MEKTYLTVPKNRNLLDFIMDMDKNTLSCRLAVHKNLLEKLIKSCSEEQLSGNIHKLIWYADDVYCERSITIDASGSKWKRITDINIFRVEYNPTNSDVEYRIA